ncbi:E3 ubiquitin/ISG15 ligase TRIM25-like [Cebus imitator]|uniref:E3 ubiquitin/ISG15 ligase TRIM25-like n=1 Tax=Cebus imitator TaxID=2715852 RepID=UPI00189A06BE|nr:E3 ubiquitin/ISG15 ligase TRIM25-like [Cebus imitator]
MIMLLYYGVQQKPYFKGKMAAKHPALPDMQRVSRPLQNEDQGPALQPPVQPSRPPQVQLPRRNDSNLRMLEDQLLCPFCREVFCNPVTITCGHNFCMSCLQGFWNHQAAMGEKLYCPQCREGYPSRPCLCKNVILGEMVASFIQAKGQASGSLWPLARSQDVACDFCSTPKLKSVKSCLQCVASLCEKHLRSHFEDQMFKDHQLLEPVWDLKNCLCRKHHSLRQMYCRTEGCCVCGVCLLEEHKNHDVTSLEEERAHKEVEVQKVQDTVENQMLIITADSRKHQGRVAFLSKLIQTMRHEVNTCFSEIIQEVKRLQVRILDFMEKEEAAALEKLSSSIQQSHNRLQKLKGDSIWLHTLLINQSNQQFLQEFPRLKQFSAHMEPLMGINCEEMQSFSQLPETLAELRTRMLDVGLSFLNQLLLKGIKMSSYEVLPTAVDRKTLLKCYCNLNFDPTTAGEELFLLKETHSVLNLGIHLEPPRQGGPFPGFKQWPQVLCSRGLSEGRHYWEVEVSNSWVCLGVTYRPRSPLRGRARCSVVYLLGRNPYSWCLEWDSLKFSVWHDNAQTVLRGAYHRTLGVALDWSAGCLSFYGLAGGASLLYRFLAAFLEPLYPALMVSSGASATLKQRPDPELQAAAVHK